MRINGKKKLLGFMRETPAAAPALRLWAQIAEASVWRDFTALCAAFPSAVADDRGQVVFTEPGAFTLLTRPCYDLEIIIVLKVAADDGRHV